MAKGVSIKFKSYEETVPKILELLKFGEHIKKYNSIVLKPSLKGTTSHNTPAAFTEQVLKFCNTHKNAGTSIFIAEGSDGEDTMDVFEAEHYRQLAEKYNVSLIDLNTTDAEEINHVDFINNEGIMYPKILKNSYVVVLPRLIDDSETEMQGALSTMLGAYPSMYYSGFFSAKKTKLRKNPLKFAIHDIIRCKMPDLAIMDASDYGLLLVGHPLEVDKRAAKLLNKDPRSIQHLRAIENSLDLAQKAAVAREAAKSERLKNSSPHHKNI